MSLDVTTRALTDKSPRQIKNELSTKQKIEEWKANEGKRQEIRNKWRKIGEKDFAKYECSNVDPFGTNPEAAKYYTNVGKVVGGAYYDFLGRIYAKLAY